MKAKWKQKWSISVSTDNITGDELLLHFDAIIQCQFVTSDVKLPVVPW